MVCSSVNARKPVGASGETASDICGEDAILSGVIQTLEEGESARTGGLSLV